MKTLKVKSILFSLLAMMAVAVFLTSCEQEEIITNTVVSTEDVLLQTGDFIEENVSYEEFLEMDKNSESYTLEFEKGESLSTELNSNNKNNICTVCNPSIYNISVYNLGGNNRGFGVSGGRNHPCSYELVWGPTPEYTVNWASVPFAHITFPGPGTYDVWVNLVSGTGNSACIIAEYVTVSI